MVADHRLLTHELGKHGGNPLFYGTLNVLISFHLVLFSPKVIIHSFTAALYSYISFAVLFESTHIPSSWITADVRITHTALLEQITQPKYNQPLPMSRN